VSFTARIVDWSSEEQTLRMIRETVFIMEQDVHEDEEFDARDPDCLHVLVKDNKERPIATARMLPDGKIGRMAVLRHWRKKGVGSAMLIKLFVEARIRGLKRLTADAQVRALPFYEKHGFRAVGDEFLDARIPHKKVVKDLT
jgi:predicted GNAT family N-acyltransferase